MGLTPDDVHHCAFSRAVGRRGYRRDDVDALLDRIEEAITEHSAGRRPSLKGGELPDVPLREPRFFGRGYTPAEADAFLDSAKAS